MVKWNSIHGHPHMHGVTHTSTVYVHANRVYSHPTTKHPSSPPSSQVPHSCSAFSACSVHVTHNTWNNLGLQTHSSQHTSLSLQSGTVSMDTHCAWCDTCMPLTTHLSNMSPHVVSLPPVTPCGVSAHPTQTAK